MTIDRILVALADWLAVSLAAAVVLALAGAIWINVARWAEQDRRRREGEQREWRISRGRAKAVREFIAEQGRGRTG